MKFKDIEFGRIAAEYELTYSPKLIIDGFLDAYGYIDSIINSEKFLILGPKGSGKSAIGSKLEVIAQEEGDICTKSYYLDNFPYNRFSEVIPCREAPETKYPDNWEFILMVASLNSFIEDKGFRYPNTKKAKTVLKALFDLGLLSVKEDLSLENIVKTTTDKNFKIGLSKVGYESSKKQEKITNVKKLYSALQEIFYLVELQSKHFIIIDGLDDVLTQREKQYKSLSALVATADKINKKFYQKGIKAKIITMCRTDLFNKLSEPNKNKIKQNSGIVLDWHQDKIDLKSTNLSKLVNLRAKISLGEEIDVFEMYLPPDIYHGNQNKEIEQVLFDYTRHLPRDIIQLFNEIQKHSGNNEKPSKSNVKYALTTYSKDYFVGEIKDHLCGFLKDEDIEKTIQLLVKVKKNKFDISQLEEIIESDDKFKSLNLNDILNFLFDSNAIGNIDKETNFVTFKYRNQYAEFNPNQNILVHYGLRKGLNLSNAT
ncbi:hypothetical protein MSMTP_2676 [Methanosarcina sp. MTP4]|uniref:P-loop ATPase, Sll1717 family n=1 Tax=Methanosarcina sp. MTP4 TaxID=1434100 RepID=UPI0006154E7A|nr:hypothetical protein [Methanosarcina sp. MTP4]AKB26145.1 hypothetical protein MSMTP_2676 [Methanosarcina sp. MTP4]